MATSSTLQHGYFVLADISGFTAYLAATELEHAQETLADLMDVIVGRLTPTLAVSKLEGDAVFAYAPASRLFRGETLLELVEATYAAFKDRVVAVERSTTCTCNACRAIPTLDLKFLAHSGAYVLQRVAGGRELLGSDVNLVHRLLKNSVSEATGWRAYALFTEQCLAQVGVQPEGLHAGAESYEHLGEVKTFSLDLHPRYQALVEARRVVVSAEEADLIYTLDLPVPPPVAWEWFTDKQKWSQWTQLAVLSVAMPGGRSGVGMLNHCAHGKNAYVRTVLDWRPFEYYTEELRQPNGRSIDVETVRLTPHATGTHVEHRIRVALPLPGPLRRFVFKLLVDKHLRESLARLEQLVAAEAESSADAGPISPAPPVSS